MNVGKGSYIKDIARRRGRGGPMRTDADTGVRGQR